MKRILSLILIIGMLFLSSSCTGNESETDSTSLSELTVQLTGFEISQSSLESGKYHTNAIGDNWGISKIDVAIFDSEGSKVCDIKQSKGDEDFGTIKQKIHVGKYKVVAIARAGNNSQDIIITSPEQADMQEERIYDVFCAVKEVDINGQTPTTLTMSLDHVISMFCLNITDAIPDDVKSIQIIFRKDKDESRQYSTFNPSTGLQSGDYKTGRTAILTSHDPQSIKYFSFLTADEESVDITVNALNEEGTVLFTHSFENVPMKRNRKTSATGAFFTNETTTTFSYTDSWLSDYTMTF